MGLVVRLGEGLARQTSRRESLRRAVSAAFGVATAWAAQGPFGSGALAATRALVPADDGSCNPPNGDCSAIGPSYCNGAACAGGCTVDLTFYDVGGCWCSATSGSRSKKHYYKCCDCLCPLGGDTVQCGCRRRMRVREAR